MAQRLDRNSSNLTPIEIPLTPGVRQTARNLAANLINIKNVKQAYLNGLAVGTVRHYLRWMNTSSEPLVQSIIDRATAITNILVVNDCYFHCCPILRGQTTVDLPPNNNPRTIATVFVRLRKQLDYAELLGFIAPNDNSISIELANIASIDLLLDLISFYSYSLNK